VQTLQGHLYKITVYGGGIEQDPTVLVGALANVPVSVVSVDNTQSPVTAVVRWDGQPGSLSPGDQFTSPLVSASGSPQIAIAAAQGSTLTVVSVTDLGAVEIAHAPPSDLKNVLYAIAIFAATLVLCSRVK